MTFNGKDNSIHYPNTLCQMDLGDTMNYYSRNRLIWKKNSLFYQDVKLAGLIPNKDFPGMYFVIWPDGIRSKDCYNKTWAKQHCYTESLKMLNIEGMVDDLDM